jgi:hypothetical protein
MQKGIFNQEASPPVKKFHAFQSVPTHQDQVDNSDHSLTRLEEEADFERDPSASNLSIS